MSKKLLHLYTIITIEIIVIRKIINKVKNKSTHLNYGREIILDWCCHYISSKKQDSLNILDIGCAEGKDLTNVKKSFSNTTLNLFGIEGNEIYAQRAKEKGIDVFSIDIEREIIPFKDELFDIIIINQIIEHTKEIFWIFSEISRTLKKGGICIVGVPNLASLHNRLLLLAGEQPSSIEILGPHIRGFTAPSLKRAIETDNYFKVEAIRGSNFYPFPPSIANFLSNLFPQLSVTIFFLITRQNKKGPFIQVLDTRAYDTLYFKGK